MPIPKSIYAIVRERAKCRCEYCQSDGIYLIGRTSIGRATCNRLDLNDEKRSEGFIQEARKQWVASGLHPPNDDPRQ
jgi:hypothetical protein